MEYHPIVEGVMCSVVSGLITDGLIYVFLTAENRETMARLFCCCVFGRAVFQPFLGRYECKSDRCGFLKQMCS